MRSAQITKLRAEADEAFFLNYALPYFNVGLQKGQMVGPFRQFMYSFLAFLTAKTLPLGLEGGAAVAALRSGELFRDPNFHTRKGKGRVHTTSPAQGLDPGFVIRGDELYIEKRHTKIGRIYLPVFLPRDFSVLMTLDDQVGITAEAVGARGYHYNAESGDWVRVFYNPYFVARTFFCLCSAERKKAVEIRESGCKVTPPSRLVSLLFLIIFAATTALDVLVGAVMRALQAPYFVMMYCWHRSGRACFFAQMFRVAHHPYPIMLVSRRRDRWFTYFAVVMNSVVLAVIVDAVLLTLFGHSMAAVGAFSGALAVLTIAGLYMTVKNLGAHNARLLREAALLTVPVWREVYGECGQLEEGQEAWRAAVERMRGIDTAEVTPEERQAAKSLVGSLYEHCNGALRAIGEVFYLSAIVPGAYLPADFSAGYCGTTAISFVEELLHAVPHFLSSVTIAGVEKFYGVPSQE